MSDWKKITVADVEMLSVNYQQRITESYLDDYKHMNVMWYTHLFSCALDDIFQRVGLTQEYFEVNHTGTFALEGHVRYINKVRVGQQVSIRTRAVARSDLFLGLVCQRLVDDLKQRVVLPHAEAERHRERG